MFYTPFTQPQQFMAAWKKMVDDHVARVDSMNDQYAAAETQSHERVGDRLANGRGQFRAQALLPGVQLRQ